MASMFGGRWNLAKSDPEPLAGGGVFGGDWSAASLNAGPLSSTALVGTASRTQADWERQMESADQQQAQLFHMQWNLLKEQMSQFSREMTAIRQEIAVGLQSGQKDLRELKESCDMAFGQVESQVMQNMKHIHSAVEAKHADHEQKFSAGLRSLEGQLAVHQRDFKAGFDGFMPELERMAGSFEKRFGEHHERLNLERMSREQHAEQIQEHMQNEKRGRDAHVTNLNGVLEALDQKIANEATRLSQEHHSRVSDLRQLIDEIAGRERAAREQNHLALQDQMGQQHAGLHDRLSKHDERHNGLQAALEKADREMRSEIGRVQSDHQDGHGQLKSLLDGHRAAAEGHKMEVANMERALRDDLGRLANDSAGKMGSMSDMFGQHKADFERYQQGQRGVLDEHRGAHGTMCQELEDRMRAELARQGAEHGSALQRMSNEHGDALGKLGSALDDHKTNLDGHISCVAGTHEDHAKTLKDLEARIRQEMGAHVDNTAAGQAAHKKAMEELEKRVRDEAGALAEESRGKHGDVDKRHAVLSDTLGTLDQELRREISRLRPDNSESRLREMMDTHKAGIDKQLAGHRDLHEGHRATMQSSQDDLEKQIRKELGKLAGDHQEYASEFRGNFRDHKSEMDKRIAAEKAAREDFKGGLAENMEALDRGLKKEIARLAAEHGDAHSSVRDALEQHRASTEKGLAGERESREAHRDAHLASLKDMEKALRKDFAQLGEDHQAGHDKIRDLLTEHKSEHRGQLQSALEALDKELKRELQRQGAEFKSSHQKLADAADEHRSSLDRNLAGERSGREEHKAALQDQVSDLEALLRRENARIENDHASAHQALRDAIGEHKSGVDKALGGEKALRDEHRGTLMSGLERLEADLRKELQRTGDVHQGNHLKLQKIIDDHKAESRSGFQSSLESLDVDLRRFISQAGDDHAGRHASLSRSVEGMDAALRNELSSHKGEHRSSLQKAQDELNKLIQGLSGKQQTGHVKMQELLAEHKGGLEKHMLSHFESLREFQSQEKSERFRHHASLQERIDVIETALVKEDEELRERLKTQLQQPSGINRGEFDSEIHRIWQAIDTHTHNVVEEPKQPQIIEERIIIQEQVQPAQPTYLVEEIIQPMQSQMIEERIIMQAPPTTVMRPQPMQVMQPQMVQATASIRMGAEMRMMAPNQAASPRPVTRMSSCGAGGTASWPLSG